MILRASGLLFDSDGVLVDSDDAVQEVWSRWAEHWGLDPDVVVPQVHGTPSRRTVARLVAAPHRSEALTMIDRMELEQADRVRAMPGAATLLRSLPPGTWAIVTSGTGALARARLAAAGLPTPTALVTADDVERGKPDPEPYLTAAGLLGERPADCLVFEDSAAGIAAARAAGVGHLVGVSKTDLSAPGAGVDAFVPDLRHVVVAGAEVRIVQEPVGG
ncbi:MAG TPA: HAD-IA family hydrolase [Nocardioides sp.]|uniref:HAD-IA family hydrolase n=1 Tax=Nocardioides sp. TaxID=35761 RepID=UPI002B6FE5E8|nr:HAD-IA family hydrolase [Nocardioides sp.]HQR27666.1 HAD-IA family hydrolase [Nocardioides sp.]